MAREIPLTRGKVAIVDDEDYPLVIQFRWHANQDGRTVYARRSIHVGRKAGKLQTRHELMHRVILGAAKGQQVDHIDGDGLNNRRSNLRLATNQQNAGNQRLPVHNTTGFKGVTFAKREGRYQAVLEVSGRRVWCGYHDTAEAAARAYDAAAIKHFGDFSRLNFPNEGAAT